MSLYINYVTEYYCLLQIDCPMYYFRGQFYFQLSKLIYDYGVHGEEFIF